MDRKPRNDQPIMLRYLESLHHFLKHLLYIETRNFACFNISVGLAFLCYPQKMLFDTVLRGWLAIRPQASYPRSWPRGV